MRRIIWIVNYSSNYSAFGVEVGIHAVVPTGLYLYSPEATSSDTPFKPHHLTASYTASIGFIVIVYRGPNQMKPYSVVMLFY